jgi:predicted permease
MKLPRWLRWRSENEFDEELSAHLELAVEAGIERGLTPEEARFSAVRAMGNVTRVKERARAADPLFRLETAARDVRHALRGLRRNPGFTAAGILSLALGIGVNCAIFSFVDGLLLRPLDVRHPEQIVDIGAAFPRGPDRLSYREYAAYRDLTQTLSGLVAETNEYFAVQTTGNDQARIAFGDFVSGNYFSVFGVQPVMGRSFPPEEDSPAAKDVAGMLSYSSWQSRFHSDRGIVGRRIEVNGQPVVIIGVLPERFIGTNYFLRTELYLPLAASSRVLSRDHYSADQDPTNLSAYGRLKPGVSANAAQAEFTILAKQIQAKFPDLDRERTATLVPDLTARLRADPDDAQLVYILLAIAGVVLFVACLNVANLLLERSSARVKEITIRQSVGATRGRLIGQMLTESVVLAVLGACGGVLLASWAIHFMATIRISPDFSSSIPARLDGRVTLYALSAAACAVLVSGIWPALRATRVDLISPIKNAVEPARRALRARNVLVAAQTALATMLLVSGALFVKSFILTSRANPGFRVENVLVVSFDPALGGYTDAKAQAFYKAVEERVNHLPGVVSAAMGSHLPMGTNSPFNDVAPGDGEGTKTPVMFDRVEPGYFQTMAVPIVEGRVFDNSDKPDTPGVAIVNQELARRFWPNADAVGRRIWFRDGAGARELEVVGVAGNGKYQSSIDHFEPYLYVLNRQFMNPQMTLFVHTAGDPAAMTSAIREAVTAVAPDVPMFEAHTMREIFDGHGLLPARLMALMVGAMGAIGMLLGVLGLYAVVAFAVTRRTREIGIRMALGATAKSILRRVLAFGLTVTGAGAAIGLAGAFTLTRYVAEFLDGVGPRDPAAFFGVPAVLVAAALAACWTPARRASRVDPAITLHYE